MVTLACVDFWQGFDPEKSPIVTELRRHGAQLIDDPTRAELLFVSVYGARHLGLGGTKISYSGETRHATGVHWTIDGRLEPCPTHLPLGEWAHTQLWGARSLTPAGDADRRFCNFIYSNPACETRNRFFDLLNERKHVDALGTVRRNFTHPLLSGRNDHNWSDTKHRVLRDYRFTIAFENVEAVGYTTEKLLDAWLNDSVPIYWGNPAIFDELPRDAMLSPYLSGSLEQLVDDVLEAHQDPSIYGRLQAANPFRTGLMADLMARFSRDLALFASRVVEDAEAHSKVRRTTTRQRARWRIATALGRR